MEHEEKEVNGQRSAEHGGNYGRFSEEGKECGYDKCGIIPVEQMAGYADSLDEREERLPETKEFYDKFRPFADPRAQYPWVESIIVCSFRYGRYDIPGGLDKHYAQGIPHRRQAQRSERMLESRRALRRVS